ncbi:MAG TPA: amino acid adenylation domain-containing protein, partial [Candidatus Thermoplasmatota archaeon]|nr:amino acid adenylation domain-containing protein [Candidatus Thermoplasmatota archaeon]
LHDLFAEQAARTPDRVAVTFEDEQVTYAALDARANRLAHRLRRMGVGPGTPVALCLERSVDLVVAMLGALKAGGAYVPLDPAYPQERLAFMLRDAGAPVLVTHRGLHVQGDAAVLRLDEAADDLAREPAHAPESGATPSDLAYVIYTSGSTGQPKGVMVEHAQVARLFTSTDAWFGFTQDDVWTMFHSFSFDFSVWETWGALLYGGRLVVVPRDVARDARAFHALLRRERVTVLNQTPSAFRHLMREDEDHAPDALALRLVVFGGEALDVGSLRGWLDRHGEDAPRLVNMYGITETTVHVTYRPIRRADAERPQVSPIGEPIPDLTLRVLDAHGRPVPVGVPGELYVGGAGVARGYLNRPELNAQRFLARDGERLYRTGDLAKRLPDGDVAYLGRIDHQVKVRGFRIELGEVEAALGRHPRVRECVVVARQDAPGETRLVAYVVPRGDAPPTTEDLRDHLRASLPDHMVPAAFLALPALPLTSNGKVDRKALPAPESQRPDLGVAYVAPRTSVEAALAEAWREALHVERVGVHDNFFALGGDSLRSIRATLAAAARGVPAKPKHLFERQTIAELAALFEPGAAPPPAQHPCLVPIQRAGAKPPLFYVHPGGGTVGCYVRLALDLGADRPFYALQAQGADDEREPHLTLEDMARAYVDAIRTVQPRGPYRLGGWSLGGMIAYEMARRLEALGEEVALLALVEPGLPSRDVKRQPILALQK